MQWLRARWAWLAGAAAWLAALRLAAAAEFGLVFLIASGLVAVFINLDRSGRSKGLSAYAAFNKDGEARSLALSLPRAHARARTPRRAAR
jgi:hypothetical protein